MTSSLRVTPLRTVTVLLLTSLSLRCQETVGEGLPAETRQIPFLIRTVAIQRERIKKKKGRKKSEKGTGRETERKKIESTSRI